MRLYRGLSRPYRKNFERNKIDGVNFTDCPASALLYAKRTKGEVLVIDLPEHNHRGEPLAHEALWLSDNSEPRRYIVHRDFEPWLVAKLPAKELRQVINDKSLRNPSFVTKSMLLTTAIKKAVDEADYLPVVTIMPKRRPDSDIFWDTKFWPTIVAAIQFE